MSGRKVYLAARYSRREELCSYRADLELAGFTVTSRWLNGEHQISDSGLAALGVTPDPTGSLPDALLGKAGEALVEDAANQSEDAVALRTRFAVEDLNDVLAADIVVSFTEAPRASASRGGRHVEFGLAVAWGRRCLVVGPRENVFHCLPDVELFDQWHHALAALLRTRHRQPTA